jgi:hypothetical protein
LALLHNEAFTQTSSVLEAAFHPLNAINLRLVGLVAYMVVGCNVLVRKNYFQRKAGNNL